MSPFLRDVALSPAMLKRRPTSADNDIYVKDFLNMSLTVLII